MSDYDPRDYAQTGECETCCYQPGTIHHIDDVWQCDHCLREQRKGTNDHIGRVFPHVPCGS